jgi:hypothetical protein
VAHSDCGDDNDDQAPTNLAGKVHCDIYRIAASGQVMRREEVDLQKENREYLRGLVGFLMPTPVAADVAVVGYRPWRLVDDGLASSYPVGLTQTLDEFWPALAIAHLIAVALAIGVYRRQRHYGADGTSRLAWSLFVLAGGLPGWIGYLYYRSWPVLKSCPACEAMVPQDRTSCMNCDADFPLPALKGTEIFDYEGSGCPE